VKVKKIDHIGIVVRDIEDALKVYRDALGLELARIEERPEIGVKIAFLPAGDSDIELVQPTTEEGGVAAFLKKRRGGLHHICLEVEDIEAALVELRKKGLTLIDEQPRQGTHGERFAFVHPKSTRGVLLELYELAKP